MFSWTITVPQNKYISITFRELALQAPYGDCNTYVAVMDGVGESAPELGRFCGFAAPDPIAGYSNTMTINFVMTASMPGKFLLDWNAVNYTEASALRRTEVTPSGNTSFVISLNQTETYVLTSPGYPNGQYL